MLIIMLLALLIYILVSIIVKNKMSERYKVKYEFYSATIIKYDKHSLKVYGILTMATMVCFLLALLCMVIDFPPIQNSDLEEFLAMAVVFCLYFGAIGTIYLGYHWVNAIFYLKRLEKYGYEVPQNRKEYQIVERLPKREAALQPEEKEYHEGSKVLVSLTILIAVIMLTLTGYYFYKWSFIDDAKALFVIQLIVDAFWLIPISVFYKEMNVQRYKDDVEIDITRKTRMNVVSGILLLLMLILIASYVKLSAHSMTRYVYVSRMAKDREKIQEIHNALETASYEMQLFYNTDSDWVELEISMREGVDITSWGILEGQFQAKVANVLGITDFGSLKEEYSSARKPAVVYVKLENDDITVELQNLYPAADREVIAK